MTAKEISSGLNSLGKILFFKPLALKLTLMAMPTYRE
jgi:hypothetical protein